MKLVSRLKNPGSSLFLIPSLNVLLLLLVFFLVNSNLVVRSGIEVTLPVSASSLKPYLNAAIVSIINKENVTLYLNDKPLDVSDLKKELALLRKETGMLLIKADEDTPQGWVVKVQEAAFSLGFEVALSTQSLASPAP